MSDGRARPRRVLRRSDESFGERHDRPAAAAEPSSEDSRWSHDLYEGSSSSDPGSVAFVRNLPSSITTQQLHSLFVQAGEIAYVKIDAGALTTARIGFVRKTSSVEAVKRFHGMQIRGRAIKVSEFTSLDAQDAERRNAKTSQNDYLDGDIDMKSSITTRRITNSRQSALVSDAPRKSIITMRRQSATLALSNLRASEGAGVIHIGVQMCCQDP
ncbi:uncharacterized protein LOC129618171 [Condylostylus longicornis]|uniref:uncharacterized protein LOC129618171 n=1 Tax=Condylostylus longicornis TaxID=2530218 RepID=UPI00244DD6D0|nr:uncharacterized protein LOC129618171 [Condylostylus longicornis]